MVKGVYAKGASFRMVRRLDAPDDLEMTKVGEETGTLPNVFHKVADYYQKELISRVERIIVIFEPLMIVVMGFLIGGIVISLFMPIFKIATLSN